MISQYVLPRDHLDAKNDEEGVIGTCKMQWKAACEEGLLLEANEPRSDFSTAFDPERIFVRNDGPYFLDTGFGFAESNSDQSLPNGILIEEDEPTIGKLRIILKLTIGGSHDRQQGNGTVVDFTPQLCLRFNAAGRRHLIGAELWDVDHFDIEMLKCWIRGCDEMHGSDHCLRTLESSMCDL
ncbi:hypothetical protein Daus18300_002961 [Diaporthe australafricana]|uniref:Uncharacterized protein n=1 Tax=Diaporthe australafricana TaxID=127596 RepID=A0ABR3XIJ1_9PEZI